MKKIITMYKGRYNFKNINKKTTFKSGFKFNFNEKINSGNTNLKYKFKKISLLIEY